MSLSFVPLASPPGATSVGPEFEYDATVSVRIEANVFATASVTADAPTAITPGYAAGKSSCWPSVPGNSLPAAATTVTPLAIANATAACSAASAPWLCAEPMLRLITEAPLATAASDCQSADTADEATAIRDAVANGASVISLSIVSAQSQGADAAEEAAVAFAIVNGVTVVATAGNEFPGTDGQQLDFPAAYPGVIAVGASAVTDAVANTFASILTETVASYSNSGPTLVAPGGDASGTNDNDILHWIEGYSTTTAAFAADKCSNSGGVCRVLFNGTSQATPQVAGTIALMEAFHGGKRSLSPATVLSLLQANSDPIAGISATRQGAGRLNAGKAVAAAHPY